VSQTLNKVVGLLGGSGLIGKAIAQGLVKAGAIVHVGSRRPPKKELEKVHYHKTDISDEASVKKFISTIQEKEGRIDVLINCALPPSKSKGTWQDLSSKDLSDDLNHHLVGYYNACRYAMKQMKAQGGGSIINFGSIYGELAPDMRIYEGTEITRLPTYSLIKAGVHMLSKYFSALGAKEKVRVNTIAPGGVVNDHSPKFQKQYSERVPMGRMATPDDIVGPVLFFASDASSYVTGQLLFVDGGLTAW